MLQHVLRRLGFGASRADLELYGRLPLIGRGRLSAELRPRARRHRRQDQRRRLHRRDHPRPVLAQHRRQRRPPALAVPHGAQPAPAAGEDGALLAQPLRHRVQQGGGHVRPGTRHQDDGRQGGRRRRPAPRAGAAVSRPGARPLRRAADRSGQGPGDAGVARRPAQRPGPAAGKLRPRADGALHHRRRPLHRGRRLRRRARLHRLEPAPGRGSRQRADQLLRVRLQRRAARPDRQDLHLPGDARRLADDSSAGRRRGRAGRPRSHPRAGPPSRDRRPAGPQALRLLRQRTRGAGRRLRSARCARPI